MSVTIHRRRRARNGYAAAIALCLIAATFGIGHAGEAPDRSMLPAPAGLYVTDPAHTQVIWSLDHSGLSHWSARFVAAKATLDWRPDAPADSRLEVEIDPASLRTDFPHPEETNFDQMIAEDPDFLAGAPIRFVSREIELTGARTGIVRGDLTFRGQTHPAELAVTFNGSMAEHPFAKTAKLGFSAVTRFDRSDWGLNILVPMIGDEITLSVETQMTPADG